MPEPELPPPRSLTAAFATFGGIEALRPVIADFIDRVRSDVMIGFHFNGVDVAQLKQRELEFSARALGADVAYSGRPLRRAHARHPILPGQFDRRLTLLRQTLADHAVPAVIATALLAHTEALRGEILLRPATCAPPPRAGKITSR